jgi:hypothetical protein
VGHVRIVGWRLCTVVVCAASVLALAERAVAAPAPLEMLLTADGFETTSIPLSVRPGSTEGSALFYVRGSGPLPVAKVRLVGALEGVPVQFTVNGTDAQGTFDVPAGHTVYVVAKVTAVRAGQRSARIAALVDGVPYELGQLAVAKAAEAAISVDGAGTDGVKLTTPTAAFAHEFQLVSTKDEPVEDLRIAVSPFTDETGVQSEVGVQVDGAALDPRHEYPLRFGETLSVVVSAPLAAKGVHRSAIRLRYGGQLSVTPIEVTRTKVTPSVAFDEVSPYGEQIEWQRDDVDLEVPARETDGRSVELQRPTLILKRKDGARETVAHYRDFTVDGAAADGGISIAAGAAPTLHVRVRGIQGAGVHREASLHLRRRRAEGRRRQHLPQTAVVAGGARAAARHHRR